MKHTFYVKTSCHGMMSIEGEVPLAIARFVRGMVCQNYVKHPDYQAKEKVSPFVQGFEPYIGSDPMSSAWILIEFWSTDLAEVEKYVAYINQRIAEEPEENWNWE